LEFTENFEDESKAINNGLKGFVHSCFAYTLEPNTVKVIRVKTSHKNKFKCKLCLLLTEDKQYSNKITLRNSVSEIKYNTFSVEVINLSNNTVQIKSSAILGIIETIESNDTLSLNLDEDENKV
jgi:hypothetical protein